MELENITVREFFEMEDSSAYEIFIDTMNPKNYFAGREGDYASLTFDEVEVIKGILNEPNLEDIKDVYKLLYKIRGTFEKSSDEIFFEQSVFDLFASKIYLVNFIKTISKREKDNLTGEPDEKMIMVNAGERLSAVSHLLTKIRLAKQFGVTPKEVGSWKYNEVFSILVAEKRYDDVLKDYNQIK